MHNGKDRAVGSFNQICTAAFSQPMEFYSISFIQGEQAQQTFTRETEVLDAIGTLDPVPSTLCTAICKSQAGPEPWVAITPFMPDTLKSVQDRYWDLYDNKLVKNCQLRFDMVLQALRVMVTVVRCS